MKPELAMVFVVQGVPSSEETSCSAPEPMLKLLNEMYIRPYLRLKGLLSTHIDSRSSAEPLCAHAPVAQVMPSFEVHMPMPWPPQPVAKSPANHLFSFELK